MTYSAQQMRRGFARQRRDIKWTPADTLALLAGLAIAVVLFAMAFFEAASA